MNEILFRKIERLKEEALYLETNKKNLLKNLELSVELKKIAERSVYLCAEITLDIAETVIAIKELPKPSTYSDSIYKLGDYKIMPKEFARNFAYIAGLRNFLAHDYQIETIKDLMKFLKTGLADVKKFIEYMERV
jgi:uncharacterized protein YutE (UPF0331/DUF86 family)